MADYEVPVNIDGREMVIPVSGVETEDEARAAVQQAIDRDELDFSVVEPEVPGFAQDIPFAGAAKFTASAVEGAANMLRRADEWALMMRDALIPEFLFPEEAKRTRDQRDQLRVENARKRDTERQMLRAAFGSNADFSPFGLIVGEGLVFAPLAGVGHGSTFTRAVFSNMFEGGIVGSMSSAETAAGIDETIGGAAIGALMGLGASLFQTPSGVKAFAGRQLQKELDRPLAQEALQIERWMQQNGYPDFSFSIAQLTTDNPWLQGIEMGARSRALLAKQNQNMQIITEMLLRRGKELDADTFARELSGTLTRQVDDIHRMAGEVYETGLNTLVRKHGDNLVLDGDKYLDDVIDYIGELGDPRHIGTKPTALLMEHRVWLEKKVRPFRTAPGSDGKTAIMDIRKPPGEQIIGQFGAEEAQVLVQQANDAVKGLTAEDVVEVLRGHNKLLAGLSAIAPDASVPASAAAGKRLKKSMLEAMDGSDDIAIQDIQNLQNAYAYEMGKVQTITQSALGTIFTGSDDEIRAMLRNPEAAVAEMSRMPAAQFKLAKDILERTPDGVRLIEDMKQTVMAKIILDSQSAKSAALYRTDVDKLLANLMGTSGDVTETIGRRGFGLFETWEQREIINAAKALSHIKSLYVTDISKDVAGVAADTVINVVSQNAGFMARYVIRNVAKSANMENLMLNPKTRKALITLGEEGPNSTSGRLAIAYLAVAAGAWDEERKQRRMAEEQARRDAPEAQRRRSELQAGD